MIHGCRGCAVVFFLKPSRKRASMAVIRATAWFKQLTPPPFDVIDV